MLTKYTGLVLWLKRGLFEVVETRQNTFFRFTACVQCEQIETKRRQDQNNVPVMP